jgi:hypothetical protein
MEALTLSQVADAVEEMLTIRHYDLPKAKQMQVAQRRARKMEQTAARNLASTKSARKKRLSDLQAIGIKVSRLKRVQWNRSSL